MLTATTNKLVFFEATNPVTRDEEMLVKNSFRPVYHEAILTWLLSSKNSKRRVLYSLLRGEGKPVQSRPTTASSELHHASGRYVIDLNHAFNGRPKTRKLNRARFESKNIISQGIFGGSVHTTNRGQAPRDSLAFFICKKYMYPETLVKVQQISDGYLAILEEIQEWIDKKCNMIPGDGSGLPEVIHPNIENTVNRATNIEDHLSRPLTSNEIRPSSVKTSSRNWKTPPTTYANFFDESKVPFENPSQPPIVLEKSFCYFPSHELPPLDLFDPAVTRQAYEDRNIGRTYHNILNAGTLP